MYKLVNKTGESINSVKRDSIGEAIQYFAKVKNLTVDMLLSIYEVVSE